MALNRMACLERTRLTTVGSVTGDPVPTRRFAFSFYYRFYFYGVYPSAEEV